MEGEDCSHIHIQGAGARSSSSAKLNLEGDQQSDLSVHGGIDKAVYAYPSEHYPFWRQQLPDMDLPWGVFWRELHDDRFPLKKRFILVIAFGSGLQNSW
jgi:hypothetical protein